MEKDAYGAKGEDMILYRTAVRRVWVGMQERGHQRNVKKGDKR